MSFSKKTTKTLTNRKGIRVINGIMGEQGRVEKSKGQFTEIKHLKTKAGKLTVVIASSSRELRAAHVF
jgi:hypothetical protein